MKGFVLQVNGECISGAIKEGITSVLVTSKDSQCHVSFGSLDKSGMLAYTWYTADMEIGDCLNISFVDITTVSKVKEIRDYNKKEELQKESLEYYLKLKKELTEEGLI